MERCDTFWSLFSAEPQLSRLCGPHALERPAGSFLQLRSTVCEGLVRPRVGEAWRAIFITLSIDFSFYSTQVLAVDQWSFQNLGIRLVQDEQMPRNDILRFLVSERLTIP